MSGTRTLVRPITFFRQESGLQELHFLYPDPMGYCPNLGTGAKLGGFQVYGASGFQVYDVKEISAGGKGGQGEMSRGSHLSPTAPPPRHI